MSISSWFLPTSGIRADAATDRTPAVSPESTYRHCRSAVLAILVLLAIALLPPGLARAQESVPLARADLVRLADAIVTARLLSAQPRWNSRGNLIVTDYRFRIEQTELDGGLGTFEFVVTQGGGTLDGLTHELSTNPRLQTGRRYLLFLRPERGEMFSPFVGSAQGIYLIEPDNTAVALSGQDRLPLDNLLAEIAPMLQARGNRPAEVFRPSPRTGPAYPSKSYEPGPLIRHPALATAGFMPWQAAEVAGPEPRTALADAVDDIQGLPRTAYPAPNWHVANLANRPIVWDEWPHDWWVSPIDQYMMSSWNSYADNLNRISGTDLTGWRWLNGRFEMVGFPSDTDMLAQFGEAWGSTTLAICWRSTSGGVVLEADIAVNPAYTWTLDDAEGANPASGTAWNLRQSVLHELGHGWGLDHVWEFENVWWDSTMNYMPKQWRLPILHEDDTDAVRTSFPGATINTDGLVSLYQTTDNPDSTSPIYTAAFPSSRVIYHGGTLSFGSVQIENPGTVTFSSPQLGIYLNQNWRAWTDTYYLLRTASFGTTINPSATVTHTLNSTTIPASLPVGIYYPTLWLPISGDQNNYNNFAMADPTRRVTIYNNPVTLAATTDWKTWSTGLVGPSGQWDLYLSMVQGRTYEMSLCPALGNGSTSFDSILEIVGVVSNDDYCGIGSRLQYTSPSTLTRRLRVRGYNVAAQGTFRLAYRQVVIDRIFANDFD